MSSGLQFNEETTRKVESLYLTPDVVAQRSRVLQALALREGQGRGYWPMRWQLPSGILVAYAASISAKIC